MHTNSDIIFLDFYLKSVTKGSVWYRPTLAGILNGLDGT